MTREIVIDYCFIYSSDAASVGSSASEKGPGSGRSSPVVRDKKLFKSTGVKKDVGSLGKFTLAIHTETEADN